jgi:hypothetical protein
MCRSLINPNVFACVHLGIKSPYADALQAAVSGTGTDVNHDPELRSKQQNSWSRDQQWYSEWQCSGSFHARHQGVAVAGEVLQQHRVLAAQYGDQAVVSLFLYL